jgi:hypothetical protein
VNILEKQFHLVEQLFLFQHVEGRYLLQLHVKRAAEDGFGVIVLD